MKKFILLPLLLLPLMIGFGSCELDDLLDDEVYEICKNCDIVTYLPNGTEEHRESIGIVCDDELEEIEGKESTDPQGIKTVYECE